MIILRSYLDHVYVILYHAHESRMIAARARVPSTCMIWQVVLGTGTCKSINLDLARAAPYRYFTQYGPAHADQNLFQQNLLHSLVPLCVLGGVAVWRRPFRMDKAMPGRSVDQPHTHTQARPHAHTHTPISHQLLQVFIHTHPPL